MNLKDEVAIIVARAVSEAEDNLYRAKRQFHGIDGEGMKQPYGQSGKSYQQILLDYEDTCADMNQCLNWVQEQEQDNEH